MTAKTPASRYEVYNRETRRYEVIEPAEAELVTGETVIKTYWCQSAGRYVTVPGASLFTVTAAGDLIAQ